MIQVLFVTTHYPYLPGEEFIEQEIIYWSNDGRCKVTVIPVSIGNGTERPLPKGVMFDKSLIERSGNFSFLEILQHICKTLFCFRFLRECAKHKKLSLLPQTFLYLYKTNRLKSAFAEYFDRNRGDQNVVYCYWHDEACFALQQLKNCHEFRLVSRIHRADLYEEFRPHGYFPFKKVSK